MFFFMLRCFFAIVIIVLLFLTDEERYIPSDGELDLAPHHHECAQRQNGLTRRHLVQVLVAEVDRVQRYEKRRRDEHADLLPHRLARRGVRGMVRVQDLHRPAVHGDVLARYHEDHECEQGRDRVYVAVLQQRLDAALQVEEYQGHLCNHVSFSIWLRVSVWGRSRTCVCRSS